MHLTTFVGVLFDGIDDVKGTLRFDIASCSRLSKGPIKAEDLAADVRDFIGTEKESRSEEDKNKLTFSLKVDKDVQMRYVNTIKNELRQNNALKINYATGKKSEMNN